MCPSSPSWSDPSTAGRVQAPCDERVPETPAEIPHGFVPPRVSASVDLLSPSRTGVTERSIGHSGGWMRKNRKSKRKDLRQIRQSFKRRSSLSGMPLPLFVRKQSRMKIFKTSCRTNTTFSSKPNVGVIAICRRNGTSLYRNALWEKVVRENVWKDSLFRTPRRICGTRKNPY